MTPSSLAEHKYEKGVYKTPMNSIPFMTPMEKNETLLASGDYNHYESGENRQN